MERQNTECLARMTGGAERLVVDAAVGLQKRGHQVEIFTSHHEDGPTGRSFEETRDGKSPVCQTVRGSCGMLE